VVLVVRLIALLLTVMMMTGGAAQGHLLALASPDAAGSVDDTPELDTPVVPEPVVVPVPDSHEPCGSCAAASSGEGRVHAAFVFRPPRMIASR
jgi:hypothetical protein